MFSTDTFPLPPRPAVRNPRHKAISIVDPRTRSSLGTAGNELTSPHCSNTEPATLLARDGWYGTAALAVSLPTTSSSSKPDQVRDFENSTHGWRANVYARPYIPDSLSAINLSPATIVYSPPAADIEFHEYVSSFAGKEHLVPCVPMEPLLPPEVLTQNTSPLTITNYATFFGGGLAAEFGAEANAITSHNMYKAQLYFRNVQEQSFELQIPGMREDRPRVDVGDTLTLRQLRIDHRTGEPLGMNLWLLPGGGRDRGLIAPGFTGLQHQVYIWGLDRTKEIVILRLNSYLDKGLFFNVIFEIQQRRYDPLQRAVADASHQLCHPGDEQPVAINAENSQEEDELGGGLNGYLDVLEQDLSMPRTWMRRMLFPDKSDGVEQEGLPEARFRQEWFDDNLNYEQMKAVNSIQQQDYGGIPFLISGPPGTGKTKTIVETALQLILCTSSVRTNILLCAPSDPAADILALRIKEHLPYEDLFRLNAPSRSFAEVPQALLPYCHIVNDMFCLPKFTRLMRYRIVVTSCRDADILVKARVSNRDLFNLEKGVIDAIHPGGKVDGFKAFLHWSALLIDEAAQATEPEAAIPLTVVAPPDDGGIGAVLVVMAGDHQQLSPRVFSRDIVLETSLFERLFERPVYREHPLARKWKGKGNGPNPSESALAERTETTIRPPFANLFQNYRSHPAILAIPSALFYHDTLVPRATNTGHMEGWVGWRGRGWPVLFACNVGDDERELEGWGWYNRSEVKKACGFAKSIVDQGLLEERDICIMSPFREQVQLLRRTIRDKPYELRRVNIGPIEAFQGLESCFVIICTTRTRSLYLDEDHAQGLGMINEARRFNVAMTRAKYGLIVIGNPRTLHHDNSWKAFISFCWRNRLWEEDSAGQRLNHGKMASELTDANAWAPSDETTPLYISSLEVGLIYKEKLESHSSVARHRSFVPYEDDAMWVSGRAAEEALREE